MRTIQHIIDTKAVKQVFNSIPEHCVIRELTERDYGIDLMLELFEEDGFDDKKNPIYTSSGHVCYLQLKGTDSKKKVNKKDGTISYSIDKKSLLNVEKYATPFILTRVYTNSLNNEIYFLWLQRYISEVLDVMNPNWRTEKPNSVTLYIPLKNDFNIYFKKIEVIASRIKYIEELSEYCEKYIDITMGLKTIILAKGKVDFYAHILTELNRLSKLNTLLKRNNCCIDKSCIIDLINYINQIEKGLVVPKVMEDYPHNYNLDLLSTSNQSSISIENFIAENEDDTVY